MRIQGKIALAMGALFPMIRHAMQRAVNGSTGSVGAIDTPLIENFNEIFGIPAAFGEIMGGIHPFGRTTKLSLP